MCTRKMIGVLRAMKRMPAGAATRRVASKATAVAQRYSAETAADTASRPATGGHPRSVMNGTVNSSGSVRVATPHKTIAAMPPTA